MQQFRNQNQKLIACIFGVFITSACGQDTSTVEGQNQASPAETLKVTNSAPNDSTGTPTDVSISFTASSSVTPAALTQSETLNLGNGVILSEARLNIGSIKIKANEELSEEEKELEVREDEEDENEEDSVLEKQIEQEMETIKEDYKSRMEGLSEAERESLKQEMEDKIDLKEEELALLKIEAEEEADHLEAERDDSLKWQGPYEYNIITNTVEPNLETVEVLDGSYKRIEFKLKPNRTLPGSDSLLNNSVYLAGTVAVDNVDIPFSMSLPLSEEFRLSGSNGTKLDAGVSNSMAVVFEAKTWFQGIAFTSANVGTDGTIVVDVDNNKEILETFKENIKRSTKFGKDEDGDGDLEVDEIDGDGDPNTSYDSESESEDEEASE